MNNLQYDSFYKFLVSIGIILIVAPIFGLHYIISGSYDIFLTVEEFNSLSTVSAKLLEQRVDFISILYGIIPTICTLSIMIGFVIFGLGCEKWYGVQKKIDESTDLDISAKRITVENMSANEVVHKHTKEASQDQITETQNSTVKEKPEPTKKLSNSTASNSYERILKSIEIESRCYEYLKNILKGKYLVQQNKRILNQEYDIIATSVMDNIDLLFEIRYWPNNISSNIINPIFKGLHKNGITYETHIHRNWKYKLIVVTSQKHISSIEQRLNQQNSYGIDIQILTEDDLPPVIL